MLSTATALFALSLTGAAYAVPEPDIVINGSGTVRNDNSVVFDPAVSIGKVTVVRKDGELKGKVEAETRFDADPTNVIGSMQG